MRTPLLLTLLALFLAGCSSVHTKKADASLSALQSSERFRLLVRTGNPVRDKLVYELAFQQFGELLPLREQEPFTGVMEITFASTDQNWVVGSSSTMGTTITYGSRWYSGSGYIGGPALIIDRSSTVTSGGTLTWQNSTMLVVLKKSDGQRIWTADYNYKGGWEMSGFSVNTPEEAARLVINRLKSKLKNDFKKG